MLKNGWPSIQIGYDKLPSRYPFGYPALMLPWLRIVLFSAVGQPHDPKTGQPIHRQAPQQIVDQVLNYQPETKNILLAPLVQNQTGQFRDLIEELKREGFVRARIDGKIVELDGAEPIRLKKSERHTIEAVVDRIPMPKG